MASPKLALKSQVDALAAAGTTDVELSAAVAAAVATLTTAIAAKQDITGAATDAEVASVNAALTSAIAGVQAAVDALGAAGATDVEVANAVAVLAATVATDAELAAEAALRSAADARTDNPHAVTKAQVGLANADDTPDSGKPVSTAQQAALDAKAALLDIDPLDVFRAALVRRDVQRVVMVTLGSSTTSGSDATTPEKRYVNRLTRIIQAEYLLESGRHPDLIALGGTSTAVCGLLGVNGGIAGTTAADYLSAPKIAQIGALGPSLVTHMLGGNDYYTSVPVATFKTNVLAQLDALRATITVPCVHLLILSYQRFDVPQGSRPAWALYGAALREIAAAANDVAFIDLSPAYVRVGIPSTDPFDLVGIDSVHQNDFGHAFMAETLRKAMGFAKATPPSATMTFSDDFTRADGVPGNGWFASNFAIVGNQVTSTALADSTLSRAHVADNGYVQGRIKAGLQQSTGVHFRRAADDSLIRFMVRASGSNFTYTLGTFGPSSSNLNVIGTSTVVPALNDLLRVEYSGTTIRCYVNGALVITASSAWNQAETGVGFRTFVSAAVVTSWDDFAMGTL